MLPRRRMAKKIVTLLGEVFPTKSPRLNRSYALGLYWVISRILNTYNIEEIEYPKIRQNFEKLDSDRLEAMARNYNGPADDVYEQLSISMSHGTDGREGITTRHKVISEFLFDDVQLNPHPTLDPRRNYTHEETLLLYGRASGRCQLQCNGKSCERAIEFDDAVVDHILPHSRGGQTTLDNGRIAHRICNIARGNRDTFDPETMCHLLPPNPNPETPTPIITPKPEAPALP